MALGVAGDVLGIVMVLGRGGDVTSIGPIGFFVCHFNAGIIGMAIRTIGCGDLVGFVGGLGMVDAIWLCV